MIIIFIFIAIMLIIIITDVIIIILIIILSISKESPPLSRDEPSVSGLKLIAVSESLRFLRENIIDAEITVNRMCWVCH